MEPDIANHDRFIANGIPVSNVAEALPVSSFDLIYAVNGLERIAEDAEALRQLHACLRPEGKLLLYVPAFMLLQTRRGSHRGPQCR